MAYGKTFKLDSNGDLSITSERIDMVTDGDKVSQDLTVLLQTVITENVLHREMGFYEITESKDVNSERYLDHQVRKSLKQYHYAIEVGSIEITFDRTNRTSTISMTVRLISGVELEVRI